MTAKLATMDDRILARAEEAGATSQGSAVSGVANASWAGGVKLNCGYLSPYFVTDPERMVVAFENVFILIHEKEIRSKQDLLPLLEQITKSGKQLLIIAEDVAGEVLAALVVNKLRGPLQVAAVRAPGSVDQRRAVLRDLALLTGGTAFTGNLDFELKNLQMSDLGLARRITIDKNHTVIEAGANFDQDFLRGVVREEQRALDGN